MHQACLPSLNHGRAPGPMVLHAWMPRLSRWSCQPACLLHPNLASGGCCGFVRDPSSPLERTPPWQQGAEARKWWWYNSNVETDAVQHSPLQSGPQAAPETTQAVYPKIPRTPVYHVPQYTVCPAPCVPQYTVYPSIPYTPLPGYPNIYTSQGVAQAWHCSCPIP